MLFTDASKYGWAGVLTQPYEEIDNSNQSNANTDVTPKKTEENSSPHHLYYWSFQR